MLIHIRYNDYIPDIDEMEDFEKNIDTPTKENIKEYKNKVDDIINSLEDKYNIDSDGIHFVYANWKYTKLNSTIVKAFHPENYDNDEVQHPIVFIKTPKENWEDSFEKEVIKVIKSNIFYDTKF